MKREAQNITVLKKFSTNNHIGHNRKGWEAFQEEQLKVGPKGKISGFLLGEVYSSERCERVKERRKSVVSLPLVTRFSRAHSPVHVQYLSLIHI